MGRSCVNRLEILNQSAITGNVTGARVNIPADIGDYYIKGTFTEDVAGGATFTLMGNEADSTTNAFILDDLGGAQTATVVNRAFRPAMSAVNIEVLPQYLYVTVGSVTGTWTGLVELWYSKVDIS